MNLNVNNTESNFISAIVDRAVGTNVVEARQRVDLQLSLIACHKNGCPLDLERLITANDVSFCHDIYGIAANLQPDGSLSAGFVPRAKGVIVYAATALLGAVALSFSISAQNWNAAAGWAVVVILATIGHLKK